MDFGLAKRLAENGCNIVSGLAVVIDAAAHRGALVARGGITTGVLGAAFGNLYPNKIPNSPSEFLAVGATHLAEYSAEVAPRPYHFPE